MNRNRLIGALTFIGGIGLACAGLVYDVIYAGIPFQDAPPQLKDQYAFHSSIASVIEVIGLLTAAAAFVFTAVAFARRPSASRGPTRGRAGR